MKAGARVRLNVRGVTLFGGADQTGLVIAVNETTAQVAWESGQDTTVTLNMLEDVLEDVMVEVIS